MDAKYYKQGMDYCGLPVACIDKLIVKADDRRKIAVVVTFIIEQKRHWDSNGCVKIIDGDFWSFGVSYN